MWFVSDWLGMSLRVRLSGKRMRRGEGRQGGAWATKAAVWLGLPRALWPVAVNALCFYIRPIVCSYRRPGPRTHTRMASWIRDWWTCRGNWNRCAVCSGLMCLLWLSVGFYKRGGLEKVARFPHFSVGHNKAAHGSWIVKFPPDVFTWHSNHLDLLLSLWLLILVLL